MEEPIRGRRSVPSVFDTGERDAVSPSGGGKRCDRGQRKDPKQLPHDLLLVDASSTARQRPEVLGSGYLAWIMRKLFPDWSRKPASIPYGCSAGSCRKSTPRLLSSLYVAWMSSVEKKRPPPAPLANSALICLRVSSSNTGGPGTAIRVMATSGCPGTP